MKTDYITIYFDKVWRVSGVVGIHHFDWGCNSLEQAREFAYKIMEGK